MTKRFGPRSAIVMPLLVGLALAAGASFASANANANAPNLGSHHALAGEKRCGWTTDTGDGSYLVFAKGIRCNGRAHDFQGGAIGIASVRAAGITTYGWTCRSINGGVVLACNRGKRLRTGRGFLRGTHVRAVT
jgi:hypothetical protein